VETLEATRTMKVLDHGYVSLIDNWGDDSKIIEAARMSTGKGFTGWGELRCRCNAISLTARWSGNGDGSRLFRDAGDSRCPIERGGAHVAIAESSVGDEKLLRYLWINKHHTPFEMAGMTIEVQAPIPRTHPVSSASRSRSTSTSISAMRSSIYGARG